MNGRVTGLTFGALVLMAIILPGFVDAYSLTVALTLCMWIALTQSWAILSGMTGYISLGHVVFYGLGAYTVVVTWQTIPLFIAIPLAGLFAGLFAFTIGTPVLRVRGPYFVILTFGIAELVKFVVVNVEVGMGKASRLLFGAPGTEEIYYAMLFLAVVATVLTWALKRSRFGQGLVAIREDEAAAETIGIPVARYKAIAFTISAVIPGMVGGLMALRSTYFETLQVFNPLVSFTIVTMAIIGGSDDARGPILGAGMLVILSELLWANAPQLYMIILGVLLIAFVLTMPYGIVGYISEKSRRAS
ncbi:MAG: branched-chain amino acid ABC transporter permease [Rhodospirillaceae bacterium]|nr:branched-chain amino acid ABC transporter permease [Rhodospirillaceae bacterium]